MPSTISRTPFHDHEARFSAVRFGLKIFLVSLAIIFASSIIGYVIIRLQSDTWSNIDLPHLPRLLWLSTALLIASSGSIQLAVMRSRDAQRSKVIIALILTMIIGLSFLAIQVICWLQWGPVAMEAMQEDHAKLALAGFYVLTMLHAAHVIGGLIPMLIIIGRAVTVHSDMQIQDGVQLCAMYWHFLDVVWLVLFTTLLFTT